MVEVASEWSKRHTNIHVCVCVCLCVTINIYYFCNETKIRIIFIKERKEWREGETKEETWEGGNCLSILINRKRSTMSEDFKYGIKRMVSLL